MKKIISSILAISIIFSLSVNAFAFNSELQNSILLQPDGHGEYSITNRRSGNTVVAKATEDKEIFYISDNQYVT